MQQTIPLVFCFFFEKDLFPEETNIFKSSAFIPLSVEEKERLYKPWATSVIIKVLGIRVGYEYLLFKLQSLSQIFEDIRLMNLGNDFHLVRSKTTPRFYMGTLVHGK